MTEKELIEGLIRKDDHCFRELVDKYQSLVLNTCFGFLHERSDAEDITQEVFIEVYFSIHKFKQTAKLSTWLYRIAVNKSLNYLRRNKRRQIFVTIESFLTNQWSSKMNDSGEVDDIQQKKEYLLHKTIDSLPKNQKTAFILHKFEKVSYKEIAEIMDLSLSSIEGLVHRANRNIRKTLLNHYKKKITQKFLVNEVSNK